MDKSYVNKLTERFNQIYGLNVTVIWTSSGGAGGKKGSQYHIWMSEKIVDSKESSFHDYPSVRHVWGNLDGAQGVATYAVTIHELAHCLAYDRPGHRVRGDAHGPMYQADLSELIHAIPYEGLIIKRIPNPTTSLKGIVRIGDYVGTSKLGNFWRVTKLTDKAIFAEKMGERYRIPWELAKLS